MAASSNGSTYHIDNLAPPTDLPLKTKNMLLLVLQTVWINILILPCVLWEILRIIFPPWKKTLEGQVVLVTGAGRGLGKGLALKFAEEGCKVAVADINKENADQTTADIIRAGGQAKAFVVNVVNVEDVKELQKSVSRELGDVDILVNNAGLIHAEPLEKFTEDVIKTVISVNLTSHFWMLREFLPAMKKRNSGHIVAIASVASFAGLYNGSAYVATKFGVRGLMDAVRDELNSNPENKIKTTTVFPYFINTSADYVKQWDLRIAPISVEEAVDGILTAVRRNQETVFVPRYVSFFLLPKQILPRYIGDLYMRTFYCKIREPTTTEKEGCLTTALSRTNQEYPNAK